MAERVSLRVNRSEMARLMVALWLSLAVHLGVWGGYAAGKKFGWWQHFHVPTWLHKAEEKIQPPPPPAAQMQMVDPTIFVEVTHADPEPPPRAKYYSDKNSRAANPDADAGSDQPKLKGKQTDMPKTEDVPRLSKLQPSPPQESPPAAEVRPSSPMNLGDQRQVRKTNDTEIVRQPSPPKRPRTLKEAMARQQLPGQQMRQDGGVRRQAVWSSLDAKATPFGEYDRKIVEAVTQRWYDLLDSRHFAQDRTGKVTLHFKLKFDGTIEAMRPLENTVGELLGYVCQESIQQAAPFEKWPADMRRMIGANFREITFTFYYY